MQKIGLTGGIGSGKSMVTSIFAMLGVPVYEADRAAKDLMHSNRLLQDKLKTAFGAELFNGGELNRKYFAGVIFADRDALYQADSIIHPFVLEDYASWCASHAAAVYTLMEAAILFESGAGQLMDSVIAVTSPTDLRIERVMKRDNCTREDVIARMQSQLTEDERTGKATFIITNDDAHLLIPQVLTIHEKISEGMAASRH